jgi:hypothetical protein
MALAEATFSFLAKFRKFGREFSWSSERTGAGSAIKDSN